MIIYRRKDVSYVELMQNTDGYTICVNDKSLFSWVEKMVVLSDKDMANRQKFLVRDTVDLKRGIKRYKDFRKQNKGIILMSTRSKNEFIQYLKTISDFYFVHIFESIIDENMFCFEVSHIDSFLKDNSKSFPQDSLTTIYYREKLEVLYMGDIIYGYEGYQRGDYSVLSDIYGETIETLFICDLLESIHDRDIHLFQMVMDNMNSSLMNSIKIKILDYRFPTIFLMSHSFKKAFYHQIENINNETWKMSFHLLYEIYLLKGNDND